MEVVDGLFKRGNESSLVGECPVYVHGPRLHSASLEPLADYARCAGEKGFHGLAAPLGIIASMFLVSFYFLQTNVGSPDWKRILLTMMVLASLITGILLIAFAIRLKLFLAGGLFLLNLVMIFVLNGLARLPELSMSLQWIVEIINSLAWLAFALGARILFDARSNFRINSSITPPLSLTTK